MGDGSERKEHNSDIVAQLWIHKSEFQANCGWFELFCRGWLKWTRVQWFHYVPLLGTRVRRTWCLTVLPNSPSRAWWKLYIKNCDRNCLITKFISWQFPHLSLTRAWSKEPLFVFPVRTLILFPDSTPSLTRILQSIRNSTKISCLKISQKRSHLIFSILAFSTNFCPIKIDLSGNTVWPQSSGIFKKLAKIDHFWHFWLTFVHSKCKRSSLRSQCRMRLFLWFSRLFLLSSITVHFS